MKRWGKTAVATREGQSYWDRLREIDAILAARSNVTPGKRAQIRAWLAINEHSAKPRGR